MAVKTYYRKATEEEDDIDDGYFVIVFDSPAWLYNDPRPHPYNLLAPDRGATFLDEGYVPTMDDVRKIAKEACHWGEGINGKDKRKYVKPEDRLYGVKTFPLDENGEEYINLRGDVVEYRQEQMSEDMIPGYIEKRFGMKGFDTAPLRELEWGDNKVYDEPGEMSIVRLNNKKGGKKGRYKFVPLLKRRK